MRKNAVLLALIAFSVAVAGRAYGHPMSPALLELVEIEGGAVRVTWRQSIFKLPGTEDKRPVLPDQCVALRPADVVEDTGSITATWLVDCGEEGLIGRTFAVEGLDDTASDALIRVSLRDGRTVRGVVSGGNPAFTVPEREWRPAVAWSYAKLGFKHILGGVDHLLFVFGLLLLVSTTRMLVTTITSFTVGHSVTLSLAMLGLAKVPAAPVEVLIALSVFVLAVELAGSRAREVTLMRRFPWAMAGLFGLLHGLGFAGALRGVGLPEHEIPLSLFSFNGGIEAGQLVFVFAILAARAAFASVLEGLPWWTRQASVYAMGSLAALWIFERTAALLR